MRVIGILVVAVLLMVSSLFAHTWEDMDFAKAAFARGWYDFGERLAKAIYEDRSNSFELRGWAAELHFAILNQKGKRTGDQTLVKMAEALFDKYSREFGDHPAWGAAARFARLDRRLQTAQDLANQAEIEPDAQKKKELSDGALRIFEEISQEWEKLIAQFRLQVANWPPKEEWGIWKERQRPTREEQDRLLDSVFKRDLAEYKYAVSLIYYAKVVEKDKRKALLEKGVRKFRRFIDGDPEFQGDTDPPCRGQEGPQDPDPRTTYQILEHFSYIGLGQCYYELEEYEKAARCFDLVVEAEIPSGSEVSKDDILKVVDIRLQAFYLEALALNKMKKYDDAIRVLDRMFDISGKEINLERPDIRKFWKEKGEEWVALMPNVYEHPYGKMAALQKAEALAALGRHQDGMGVAWEIFKREAKQKFRGEQSPFEVEAAKTMSRIAEKLPGVEFEVGHAYGVAKGLEYQGLFDKAAEAYRKAISAKGSEEDRKVYVPESLWELATNLMNQNKFHEAVPYLVQLVDKHIEFRNIARVPGLIRQCADKAKEEGKIDLARYDELKKIAEVYVPGASKLPLLDDTLKAASEAEAKKDYAAARILYESLPKTYSDKDPLGKDVEMPYPRYAFARARLGATYLSLAEIEKARSNQQEYDRLLSLAKSTLEEALLLSTEAQDERANGTARYYLGSIYLDDSIPAEKKRESAEKAIGYLKAFDEELKDKKGLEYYLPDVLSKQANAYFIIGEYDKMHERILTLEKEHKGSAHHLACAVQFYESMKKLGEQIESGDREAAKPFFEKAAYYVYSWYKNREPGRQAPENTLWAGKALYDVRSYEKGIEVLEEYFKIIPKKEERSADQRRSADLAKVLLAECYYGMGRYREAAELFDDLRHETQCNHPTCDYESEIKKGENFDAIPEECPKCRKGRLERKNDSVFEIQEGAAKSYLAIYENSKPKDMVVLDRALDIYQRIYKKLSSAPIDEQAKPEERERLVSKTCEVAYIMMTIWREKREQDRVVKEIERMMIWVGEGNWDAMFPAEPWRTKIKELYELCKKEVAAGAGK